MASENQCGEGVSSSFRVLLRNLLSGVVTVFSSSAKKSGQNFDKTADQSVQHTTKQTADVVTTVVQDKVQDALSGAIGGSVLGSAASGVVGAMAGAVAGELVDTVLDKVSGTVLGKDEAIQAGKNRYFGLGTLTPFDDTSEIYAYVRQVIRHFEGNTASPCIPEFGKSAATISTGLDLGQHDTKSLQKMGISEDVIAILKPLLTKDAHSARKILTKKNIVLNGKQNAAVEQAIILYYMGATADAYDAALEKNAGECVEVREDWAPEKPFVATRFSMLPKEMQAVMVSVLFQHGSPQATPRFWSFATQGQWNEVVNELRDFYSEPTVLSTRRNEEADIILLGMGRIMQSLHAM